MVKGRIRVKSDYIKYRFYVTMDQKRGQMRKIRFWVCGIFSVVLYQESLCENFMALSKVLFEIWLFIYI